jgi:hypothetical protein
MRRIMLALVAAALVAVAMVPSVVAGDDPIQQAKAATARYNSPVAAIKDGYGPFPAGVPLHECIMSLEPGGGGMGIHWVNGTLLNTVIDPATPEVLVYAPRDNGRLELVALEYVVFAGPWAEANGSAVPTVFGQPLTLVPDGNRYDIPSFWQRHIWLYEDNASGLFADFNPSVTC